MKALGLTILALLTVFLMFRETSGPCSVWSEEPCSSDMLSPE